MQNIEKAAIWVGTYRKYNNGVLQGRWMTLSDYEDKNEFLKACAELHKDEKDPEFMFNDYEYIPKGMVSESWVSPHVWGYIELDEDDREIVSHYVSACSIDVDDYEDFDDLVQEARDSFVGCYDDPEDYGQQCFDEFIAPFIDEHLRNTIEYHFDMKGYGEELLNDYMSEDGYYYDTNR